MPDIVTSAPPLFFALCLLAGSAVAAILYYRERRSELSRLTRWILAVFRFVSYSALAFLLLGPVIRAWTKTKEAPVVLVLNDVSTSMSEAWQQAGGSDELQDLIDRFPAGLEVIPYHFAAETGEGLTGEQQGLRTDIGGVLDYVAAMYRNRNLGAVILHSDGINNEGRDPISAAMTLPVPIYTLGAGDTTLRRDIRISDIDVNRITFLGNRFPVRVHIHADLAEGQDTRLEVRHNSNVLHRETIRISKEDFYQFVDLEIDAREAGIQKYTCSLVPVDGEQNVQNNSTTLYIEVLDGRTSVHILAGAPHPDITSIRQAIESREQVEADVTILPGDLPDLADINLLVLYQLPSEKHPVHMLVTRAREAGVPVLFILGVNSDISAFDRMDLAIAIDGGEGKFNLVTPAMNSRFSLFHLDQMLIYELEEMPPLKVPFGEFRAARNLTSLFGQRIGSVETDKPLFAFGDAEGWKTGYLAGEGIWRWRIHLYRSNGSHEVFDNLWSSATSYLSLKEERSRFRVHTRNSYQQSDRITLSADVYNESFEPLESQEIILNLIDSSGTAYTYMFSPAGSTYSLDLGYLTPGNYRYRASVGSLEPVSGQFVVEEVNIESAHLQANHELLRMISSTGGGQLLQQDEWAQLPGILEAREDLKPRIYSHQQFTDLKNWPWYLLILLVLLTAEWLIRRIGGSY